MMDGITILNTVGNCISKYNKNKVVPVYEVILDDSVNKVLELFTRDEIVSTSYAVDDGVHYVLIIVDSDKDVGSLVSVFT